MPRIGGAPTTTTMASGTSRASFCRSRSAISSAYKSGVCRFSKSSSITNIEPKLEPLTLSRNDWPL